MVTLILTLLHFRMHIIFNSSLGTHTVEVDIHDTIDNVKNKLKVILLLVYLDSDCKCL